MAPHNWRLDRPAAVCFALLSIASLPVNAQDICSPEGRSKMRATNVTESQILRICPATTDQPGAASVDYRDIKAAIFDAANATGKTIYFDASYRKLGTREGRTNMLIKVDTNTGGHSLWYVFFDSSFNSTVSDLRAGHRLSIVCRITELSGLVSTCNLIRLSVK